MPECLKPPFDSIALQGVEQLDDIVLQFCRCMSSASLPGGDTAANASESETLLAVTKHWVAELWQRISRHLAGAGEDDLLEFPPEMLDVPPANLMRGIALLRRRWTDSILRSGAEIAELPRVVESLEAFADRQLLAAYAVHQQALVDRIHAFEHLAIVGQLASSIGHELRNPLATIENAAYLLAQRQASGRLDAPGLLKQVDRIRKHVEVATDIVDDVMAMAKQRQPRCSNVALRNIVDSAIVAIQPPDGLRIALDVTEDLMVWADAQQLRMVLVNLIANAVQAIATQGSIEVTAMACSGGVAIRVADDGPGVPGAERLRIFEPLFTTKPSGHGLGLPLCRRIVTAHGGTLTLESSEIGATFRVWLPGADLLQTR